MDAKRELKIGIVFFVIALLYFVGTFSISTFSPFGNRGLSSRSIPQLIAGLALILSFIHSAANILKMKKEAAVQGGAKDECPAEKNTFSTKSLLVSLGLISLYVLLFQRLGFVAATISYLLAECFFLTPKEKRKKWALFICCFSLGVPVFLYILFTKYLSLFLPKGILGGLLG
jgi:hypothetical protein